MSEQTSRVEVRSVFAEAEAQRGPVFLVHTLAADNAADTCADRKEPVFVPGSISGAEYTGNFYGYYSASLEGCLGTREYAEARDWFAARGVRP